MQNDPDKSMMRDKQNDASLEDLAGVPETRLGTGHSATGSNSGPSRSGAPFPEENDTFAGTSSGSSLRGKPRRGSIEDIGM